MRHIPGTGSRLLAGLGLALALGCIKLGTGAGGGSTPAVAGWSGPALLEGDLGASSYAPQAAMDGSGNVLAGWERDAGGGRFNLYGNLYLVAAGWEKSGSLPVLAGADDARNFRIAVGGDENFLYTWDELPAGGTAQVWVNSFSATNGLGMGTPLRLNKGVGAGPAIAMNLSGNACVAWTEADAAYTTIQVALYDAGTLTWTNPYTVSAATAANARNPVIAMDDADNVLVLWSESPSATAGPCTLRMASGLAASGWSAPTAVQAGAGPANGLYALALGDSGAFMVWSESSDGGATFLPCARAWSVSGTGVATLGAATPLSSVPVDPLVPVSVAVSEAGNAVATWVPASGTDLDVDLFLTSSGWSGAHAVVAATPGVASAMAAMNASGVPALVWEQLDGSDGCIYATTYSGSGWLAPVLMQSATTVSADAPSVFVSSNGQIVVVWSQADSAGLRHIYAQRYK